MARRDRRLLTADRSCGPSWDARQGGSELLQRILARVSGCWVLPPCSGLTMAIVGVWKEFSPRLVWQRPLLGGGGQGRGHGSSPSAAWDTGHLEV